MINARTEVFLLVGRNTDNSVCVARNYVAELTTVDVGEGDVAVSLVAVNKEARELERKISASTTPVSDTEYEAAATAMAKVRQEEGEIEMEYFAKFEKILTKKQLFLLKRAENKFTQSILSHHKRAGRE